MMNLKGSVRYPSLPDSCNVLALAGGAEERYEILQSIYNR
jgi:hypothetical protein